MDTFCVLRGDVLPDGAARLRKRVELRRHGQDHQSPATPRSIIHHEGISQNRCSRDHSASAAENEIIILSHLDYYLDEFTFRFNRRTSGSRGKLFFRLVQQAVTVDPVSGRYFSSCCIYLSKVHRQIIIFMILSGIHFGLLFKAAFEGSKKIYKSTVVRYYILAIVIGIVLTTFSLHGDQYKNWFEALRYAAFQITSIGTSSGFANSDSSIWPALAQILLIFFALQCACAGSTSGGIKADRFVMFWKAFIRHLKLLQNPKAVIPVRIDNTVIKNDLLTMGILYLCVYFGLVFIATIFLAALGVDILSAFSGVVATTGNVGPGLGTVGSMSNFSHIPSLGKWILTATMLLGRLEIFGLVLFFMPQIWKIKHRVAK